MVDFESLRLCVSDFFSYFYCLFSLFVCCLSVVNKDFHEL